MEQQKLPPVLLARLEDITVAIETKTDWEAWLDKQGITRPDTGKSSPKGH